MSLKIRKRIKTPTSLFLGPGDLFFMSSASQGPAVSFFLYKGAIMIVGIFKGVSYEGKRYY